jgi:hypothetical protein
MNPIRLNFPPPSASPTRELPVVPVGLDAYRQWERWACQRIGVRAHMRSTYDRTGGNERADASHFLYLLPGDVCVPLHFEGRGVLYFARYNHWHGSPWTYEVDGKGHVVQETSTGAPWTVKESKFIPEHLFPEPLALTWSTTHGANLMWVPIAFEHSFRMGYGHSFYGTGYYIYHHIADGVPLSQPIRAWDGATPPDQDVLKLLGRSATELLPARDSADERAAGIVSHEGALDVGAGGSVEVVRLAGAGELRAVEFSAPRASALAFGKLRLRVTWDEAADASIDAPLALFFGAGTLHNRDNREYLVRAFPMQIRCDAERVHVACVLRNPRAWSWPTPRMRPSPACAGRSARHPCANRWARSGTFTRPTATTPIRWTARTWCCSTRRRPRGAATGRARSSAPR